MLLNNRRTPHLVRFHSYTCSSRPCPNLGSIDFFALTRLHLSPASTQSTKRKKKRIPDQPGRGYMFMYHFSHATGRKNHVRCQGWHHSYGYLWRRHCELYHASSRIRCVYEAQQHPIVLEPDSPAKPLPCLASVEFWTPYVPARCAWWNQFYYFRCLSF